ncbi:MAG TPA: hypothetical protein VKY90_20780 [Candidatus Dormibacteraeota bacterium]|nr:hypothetical protein [Candidatus Dormibacteraeota bacterium]
MKIVGEPEVIVVPREDEVRAPAPQPVPAEPPEREAEPARR